MADDNSGGVDLSAVTPDFRAAADIEAAVGLGMGGGADGGRVTAAAGDAAALAADALARKRGYDRRGDGRSGAWKCSCEWAESLHGNRCPEHGTPGVSIPPPPDAAGAAELAGERDAMLVALDGLRCGEFRLGWLAEADALWAARCAGDGPADPDPWLWLTRSREMLRAAAGATAWMADPAVDAAVAAARRRLGPTRTHPAADPESPGAGARPGAFGRRYQRCPVCRGADGATCAPGFVCERGFVELPPDGDFLARLAAAEKEIEDTRKVVQDGVRLPAPALGQDAAYLAFVLGRLEAAAAAGAAGRTPAPADETPAAREARLLDARVRLVEFAPHAGTRWVHRKGGRYAVVAAGLAEWDFAPMMVYQADDPAGRGWVWIRPLDEFVDGRFQPDPGAPPPPPPSPAAG